MENAAPSCSVSSGGAPRNRQAQAGVDSQHDLDQQLQQQPQQPQEHNIFGGGLACVWDLIESGRVCGLCAGVAVSANVLSSTMTLVEQTATSTWS